MTLGEKIKNYRKQSDMSQEKLAEMVGVSRQAITKWETGNGMPDIENIIALSELFNVSLDEMLADKKGEAVQKDFLYESVTEYDIDRQKDYDINLGGVMKLVVSAYDGEKIKVRLASNKLASLQSDFKVKIDDNKNCIDVDMSRINGMTESAAKDGLVIFVQLPQKYVRKAEIAANVKELELASFVCENFEFNGRVTDVIIDDVTGTIELNSNLDMNIDCRAINGSLEINQLSATSKITVPKELSFKVVKKGIATTVTYEKDGEEVEDFSDASAENIIEFNGVKSELVIKR